MKIVIPNEVPSKKNSRINTRSGRSFPNKRYVQWHDMAMAYLIGKRFEGSVVIKMTFFHQDNRRRDSDNAVSSVFDVLVDAGVIVDDRWQIVQKFSVENYVDKSNPRVEIEIKEL